MILMTSKTVFCFDPEDDSRAEKIVSSFSSEIFSFPPLETRQNLSDETITQLLAESDVTVVFIGKHTFENGRCLKMIEDSFSRGNAFLAIYLNNAEDVKRSGKELLGKNPFDLFYFEYNNSDNITVFNSGFVLLPNKLKRRLLSKDIKAKADFIVTYDYIKDNGAENLLRWIKEERQRKADFFLFRHKRAQVKNRLSCIGDIVNRFRRKNRVSFDAFLARLRSNVKQRNGRIAAVFIHDAAPKGYVRLFAIH